MTSFTMLPLLLMVAMMLLGRGSTKKVLSLQAMHGEYGSLNNDADSLSPAAGTGPNGGIRAAQTRPAKFQHDLYLNLKGDLWPVQIPLSNRESARGHLVGCFVPPFLREGGDATHQCPLDAVACCSLLLLTRALLMTSSRCQRPYPVSYVVLVVTYISGAMLTGKLAQRRQGGGAIVWAGTLATVVQLLWILMAAQPFIHVCIFFRKRENRTVLMCRCCPARCQRGVNHDEELAEWAETAPMMPVEIPSLSNRASARGH